MYVKGFTKFGIKVLWRLKYLRTLHLKFQKVRAFWNSKLKVLKYSKNCSLHNTWYLEVWKDLNHLNVCMYIVDIYAVPLHLIIWSQLLFYISFCTKNNSRGGNTAVSYRVLPRHTKVTGMLLKRKYHKCTNENCSNQA